MRRSNTETLGEAIKAYLKAIGAEQKLKEIRLLNHWDDVVGKHIANATNDIYIRKGVLYVHIRSSIVKSELWMIRTQIVLKLNQIAEENILNEMVIK